MNKLLLIISFFITPICFVSQSLALPACQVHQDDYRHNCYGSYKWDDGDYYIGEWQNNKRTGKGTYIFGPKSQWSGDMYVGKFKNALLHGQGTYTYSNGDKYEGEYKDDKRNGQGVYTYSNRDRFEGEYKDGKRNGSGKYTFANGEVKKGTWENDKLMYEKKKPTPTSTLNSKLEGYKSFCSEIGFTPGTEKFGECVVEAMKKG